MWILNPQVYITVVNSEPQDGPVDFSIRVRDYFWLDTYPQKVKQWSDLYENSLEGTDATDTSL